MVGRDVDQMTHDANHWRNLLGSQGWSFFIPAIDHTGTSREAKLTHYESSIHNPGGHDDPLAQLVQPIRTAFILRMKRLRR